MDLFCAKCNTQLHGTFCHNCGEKSVGANDRSVMQLIKEFSAEFVSVDSRLFYSVRLLLLKPGAYTAAWLTGPRSALVKPVSLFFIFNFILFFVPFSDTFKSTLESQYRLMPYSSLIRPAIDSKIIAQKTDFEQLQKKYNEKTESLAKMLIFVFAILLVPFVTLIFRKQGAVFYDHIILSLEYMMFHVAYNNVIVAFLTHLLVFAVKRLAPDMMNSFNDSYYSFFAMGGIFYFSAGAARNLYKLQGFRKWASPLFMLGSILVALVCYRFLLFWITLWLV